MTIPDKGSRRIVVAGSTYRWRVSREPHPHPLVAVQHDDGGRTLLLVLPSTPADEWEKGLLRPITPSDIERAIHNALDCGWNPREDGRTLFFGVQTGKFGDSPVIVRLLASRTAQ